MTTNRTISLAADLAIAVLAGTVCWLSFTQQPSEAFLFPRLISIFFVIFAVLSVIRTASIAKEECLDLSLSVLKNIAPVLVIFLIYVFYAAKGLGFYTSSAIAFMLVYTFYDPAPLHDSRQWLKRFIVTGLFLLIIYCVFVLLLQVQTPRGLLF